MISLKPAIFLPAFFMNDCLIPVTFLSCYSNKESGFKLK
ncbi:hypothetical protein SMITH_120 [Smithella sp. ME-1]|nr:hypothetical protein SMITH_120 [Smithella sp. ME-1]